MTILKSESKFKLYSRILLLAGVANILANFAGFLFGGVLIAAASMLHLERPRPIMAVLGSIVIAIAAFISIRTVISLLFPSSVSYYQGAPFPASLGIFLMSPSPIFTLILGGPALPINSYNQAMSVVDMSFNLAAVILNFLGLGSLVWGWPELVEVQTKSAENVGKAMTSVTTQP